LAGRFGCGWQPHILVIPVILAIQQNCQSIRVILNREYLGPWIKESGITVAQLVSAVADMAVNRKLHLAQLGADIGEGNFDPRLDSGLIRDAIPLDYIDPIDLNERQTEAIQPEWFPDGGE